jgi:hypothetical protein
LEEKGFENMTEETSRLILLDLKNTWQIARGKWQISKDMNHFNYLDSSNEDANPDGLCLSDIRITDGIFEADMMVNEVVPNETNAHLVFRYNDSEFYWFAGLGGWELKFVIAQRTPAESSLRQPGWAPVASDGRIQDIVPRHWYHVKVDFSGPNVALYLGDVCVLRYTSLQRSPYFPMGNIGFRAFEKQRTHFKNPKLYQRVRASDLNTRLKNIDLSFMENATLRTLAKKDLEEIRQLEADLTPKAVVVLSGSMAECLLLDTIKSHETQARKCSSAKNVSLNRWDLDTLIEVAYELHALKEQTYATSHTLRSYRNLIHPGKPEAQELAPWPSQAVAGADFVLALLRDLSEFLAGAGKLSGKTP